MNTFAYDINIYFHLFYSPGEKDMFYTGINDAINKSINIEYKDLRTFPSYRYAFPFKYLEVTLIIISSLIDISLYLW